MKKFFEAVVQGILTCSGFVTSIVILLIIGFLFTEGAGLFKERMVEEGYVLALNKNNEVSHLTAEQIKAVFDEDIVNWKEVGGEDMPIETFRLEDVERYFTPEELGGEYEHVGTLIAGLIARTPGIVAFVPQSVLPADADVHYIDDSTISLREVFAGTEWFPTATPAPLFGILPLLAGTLWVSLFAILFALPFGLSVAVYMSEVASERMRSILKPVIELLNGIPSIVYGAFGFTIMIFLGLRTSLLGGIIVITLLIIPIFVRSMDEVARQLPKHLLDATYSLGATRYETIKVAIRQIAPGIATATLLSIGRAIGDAAGVMFTAGFTDSIPTSLDQPAATLPLAIFFQLSSPLPEVRERAYAAALLLTLIVLVLSIVGRMITHRFSKNKIK